MNRLLGKIRPFGRVLKAMQGFIYDLKRFYKYAGWRADMNDKDIRNYHSVKVYHSLEKSLSYKNRNIGSGWTDAYLTLDVIKNAENNDNIGFHDYLAYERLIQFIDHPDNVNTENAKDIRKTLEKIKYFKIQKSTPAIFKYTQDDYQKGKLPIPEDFFFSRFTLREFKDETVDENTIQRAINLAIKSPSVCNRQPWHVYHITDKELKRKALKYQAGNRGFGEKIPNLIIITTDLRAFMPGQEHYQHWIDGGMFSMSFIWALHSLGIASCCLNWSQSPSNDKAFRELININPAHTVTMMIAVGRPDSENIVCSSERRPLQEVYTFINNKES